MRDMTRYPEFTMGVNRDSSRYSYRILIANLSDRENMDDRLIHFEEVNLGQAKVGVPGNLLNLDSTFAVCGREILFLHTPMYYSDLNITIYLAEREQLGSKKDAIGYDSNIRSVLDFTGDVIKFDYTASLSVSSGDYFSFQTEKGYVEINDNPEKWAIYNAKRVYDPRPKKTIIYIYEGMNGVIDRTYTGFLEQKTFVKRSSSKLDTIKLTFKDKFFMWDKIEFTKNRVFEDLRPREFFMELLGLKEHEIEYINGTYEDSYPLIHSLPTKGYQTVLDLLKAYAKSGVRFSFDGKENLVIFSDTIVEGIVPTNSIPINETLNITDITENSKDQFVYNDIGAEVIHSRPWKNIDEFGGKDNVDYVKFLGDPIPVTHTIVKVDANEYSNLYAETIFYKGNDLPLDTYEVTKSFTVPSPGDYRGALIRYDSTKDKQSYRKLPDGTWSWKSVEDKLGNQGVEWFATGELASVSTGVLSYEDNQEVEKDEYRSYYKDDYEYRWVSDGKSIVTNADLVANYYATKYTYKTNIKKVRRKVRIGYKYSGKLYLSVFDNFSINSLKIKGLGLENSVTFGDYVLLKDNRTNDAQCNEFYGKVSDIRIEEDPLNNVVEIILGNFDKDYRLMYKGKMDWFFQMGYNEPREFTLHYGKIELPIIWKYARDFKSGTRDNNLNYPLIPHIVDDATGEIIEDSTKDIYAKFGFAQDLEDEEYAGYATHIDRMWSEVLDNK